MKLTQQTILITGGTSGIRKTLAIRLQQMGNKVIICGRNTAKLAEIAAQNPGIETFTCDVSDTDQRLKLADWAITNFPELNVLVNNAGLMQLHDLTQPIDIKKVTSEVNTNIIAPIHLGSLFTPHLSRQQNAAIINISSGIAFTPLAVVPVYCATKAAVHAFSLSQRYQLRDTGIKVFETIPPAVETELGNADGYDKSNDQLMSVEDFVTEMLSVLKNDQFEIGIGVAEGLRQQKDALFTMLNPDTSVPFLKNTW